MHAAEQKLIALTKRPHLSQLERQQAADPFVHLRALLQALGNPEQKIPHYIHITGTSGKGSTAGYVESILRANKYKTGLTVSPHITSIYERWQINGVPINTRDFNRVVKKITAAFSKCANTNPKFGLSFFELCTALALLYFAEQKVEWAVLEVFNGGRVDPTNIIPHKDAVIITNIGLDHKHLLGQTRALIAREKAGIIAPNTIVVTSEQTPSIHTIIKKISQAKRTRLVSNPKPQKIQVTKRGTQFVFKNEAYRLRTIGAHQAHNATAAISTAQALGLSPYIIKQGLLRANIHNRVEIRSGRPQIILDTAHNPDKMAATVAAVTNLKITPSILLELPANKDIPAMLKSLAKLQPSHVVATTSTTNPFSSSLGPAAALPLLKKAFPKASIGFVSNPKKAFSQLKKSTNQQGTVLVTGSTYLTSQIQGLLTERPN